MFGLNVLDLVIVLALVSAGIGGYRLGFVTRAASWLLMAAGLFVAARLLPSVVEAAGGAASQAELLLVAAGVLVAGAFLGQALGLLLGAKLNLAIRSAQARTVDAGAGAVAGIIGVLVAVWLLVPAMANVPDTPARLARTSQLAGVVEDVFPDPPNPAQALLRLVGPQYPNVFQGLQAAPDLGPPPAASGLTDAVAQQVAESTVKVIGQACSRIQEGSGFVIDDDLVVTNAHVVAGESQTRLQRLDGSEVEAAVVAFDPARDLAILAAPGLDRPPLTVGDAAAGDTGSVFGYPGGGPLEISPYTVGRRVDATGTDIYDQAPIERDVLFLSAELRAGDSGAALVDPAGRVAGVAFAIAPDQPGVAYALTTAELAEVVDQGIAGSVDTGPCLA